MRRRRSECRGGRATAAASPAAPLECPARLSRNSSRHPITHTMHYDTSRLHRLTHSRATVQPTTPYYVSENISYSPSLQCHHPDACPMMPWYALDPFCIPHLSYIQSLLSTLLNVSESALAASWGLTRQASHNGLFADVRPSHTCTHNQDLGSALHLQSYEGRTAIERYTLEHRFVISLCKICSRVYNTTYNKFFCYLRLATIEMRRE